MERRMKIKITALVAVLCVVLAFSNAASIVSLLAQPFSGIGQLLRLLSLSGGAGNVCAVVLYVLVCVSPLALLGRKKFHREDVLLLCCVGLLFYVMYRMVNPHRITLPVGQEAGKMILGGAVYSVLIAWGILKLLKRKESAKDLSMYRAMGIFLLICGVECFVAAFGVGILELRADLTQIRQANTMQGINLLPTYLVRIGMFGAAALEYTLDGMVLLRGTKLLKALEADPYSGDCVAEAGRITGLCKKALGWIVLSNMAVNLAQAVWMNQLHNIDVSVRIPVMSMAVVFGAMVLTKLLVQGKEIKDDNDLFV